MHAMRCGSNPVFTTQWWRAHTRTVIYSQGPPFKAGRGSMFTILRVAAAKNSFRYKTFHKSHTVTSHTYHTFPYQFCTALRSIGKIHRTNMNKPRFAFASPNLRYFADSAYSCIFTLECIDTVGMPCNLIHLCIHTA